MAENIREVLIEEDMKSSYINYAMSVIINRALPDVRDGLKPSQRRILVAMNDLDLSPRAKFRKCAKIVGDTAGNYHPHPESIYGTLVRMAQPFNTRYVLIDSQGNFGSLDGDPPAAVRYTEARLSYPAEEMLLDMDKDTVDFTPNYDESRTEPTVLPAKFPNLLCNGSTGIAVGMATNIPPHNLREVVDAVIRMIDEPDVTIDELMKIIKGPDFPTGAEICGRTGIRTAYRTGRGSIVMRAKLSVETTSTGRKNIIVTEIPYGITRTTIKERIAEAVNSETVRGISDFRDESDKDGQRLVIELKKGEDERVVINQLFKHTPLQGTFPVNMIALVNRRPRTLNLREMLECFKLHRIEVVRRRIEFLLRKAEDRAHILEGLKIALRNIDAIIALIRQSKSTDEARTGMMKEFGLSARQAVAILQMQLQRLTGLERDKIDVEYRELIEKINEYQTILKSEMLLLNIIKDELLELKKKYGDERRTEIVSEVAEEFEVEDLIAEESVAVTISHEGYIKRQMLTSYRKQGRGGKGVIGAGTKEGDFIEYMFIASTHDHILFFTDRGKIYWQRVYDIPEMSRTSKGRAIVNLLELREGENLSAMLPVSSFDQKYVMMATADGVIKKTPLQDFSRPQRGGIIAIKLDPGDKLVGAAITSGNDEVVLGTRLGFATRFKEEDVRAMGRAAHGVGGVKFRTNDKVVGMAVVDKSATLLTVCENGFGKRTGFDAYRLQHRNGMGVINIRISERNGPVVAIVDVKQDDELMVITTTGQVIRMSLDELRSIGRATQGVRLIRLEEGDKVSGIARVVKEEKEEGAEAAPPANGAAAEPAAEEAAPIAEEEPSEEPAGEEPGSETESDE